MIAGRRNSRRDGEIMDNGVIKTIELSLGGGVWGQWLMGYFGLGLVYRCVCLVK